VFKEIHLNLKFCVSFTGLTKPYGEGIIKLNSERMQRSFSVLLLLISCLYGYGQTIENVAYYPNPIAPTLFNDFITMSEANEGMPKIATITVTGANTGSITLSSDTWPDGTWSTGFLAWVGVDSFVTKQEDYNGDVWTGSHPLVRINSAMIRAHIHTDHLVGPRGNPVNLDKIKAGIDYMITSQRPDGGFTYWVSRPAQTIPTIDETYNGNPDHSLETAHALRTMCEAYLYFKNYNIIYNTADGDMDKLWDAILKAAENLYRKGVNGEDLSTSNYQGFALWGLASAYKVTKLTKYLDRANQICKFLIQQQTNGGLGDGIWNTPPTEGDFDVCNNPVYHDSFINYHMIILRGLIEAMDIMPSTPKYAVDRVLLISSIKRAVNNVIKYRIAYTDDPPNGIYKGFLRSTWLTQGGQITCSTNVWADYLYTEPIEPIAMLALYSKFHPEFSEAEQINLRNLLLVMGGHFRYFPTDPVKAIGYFSQYAYYADYLDAAEKRQRIFPQDEHDCPTTVSLIISTSPTQRQFVVVEDFITATATINPGIEVAYAAGQEITLDTGFTASSGSNFTAFIYPCALLGPTEGRYGNSRLQETDVITSTTEKNNENAWLKSFPNPFSEHITIDYRIPKSSMVIVSIYDYYNREIAVLVNEAQSQGDHQITFDGSKLNSGLYFCKIKSAQFSKTNKLMIMR
jgi:hypothetical protein